MEPEYEESITVHDYELTSDCDSDGASEPKDFSKQGMELLEESAPNEKLYSKVRRNVALSMGSLGNKLNVVAIHMKVFTSVEGQAKLHKYNALSQAVAARLGGFALERNVWYGGSRREICDAARFGFGRTFLLNGNGLCLSDVTFPLHSVMRTSEDEEGLRHMLMCRVILGRTETITACSLQIQADFDSVVDDPVAPTRYWIWNADMITTVLPYLILSFTAPSLLERKSWTSSAPSLDTVTDTLLERKGGTFSAKRSKSL